MMIMMVVIMATPFYQCYFNANELTVDDDGSDDDYSNDGGDHGAPLLPMLHQCH